MWIQVFYATLPNAICFVFVCYLSSWIIQGSVKDRFPDLVVLPQPELHLELLGREAAPVGVVGVGQGDAGHLHVAPQVDHNFCCLFSQPIVSTRHDQHWQCIITKPVPTWLLILWMWSGHSRRSPAHARVCTGPCTRCHRSPPRQSSSWTQSRGWGQLWPDGWILLRLAMCCVIFETIKANRIKYFCNILYNIFNTGVWLLIDMFNIYLSFITRIYFLYACGQFVFSKEPDGWILLSVAMCCCVLPCHVMSRNINVCYVM